MRQNSRPSAAVPKFDPIPWETLVRSPAIVAIFDAKGLIIQATERFCGLFEYAAEEFNGLHVEALVPEGLHPRPVNSREDARAAPLKQWTSRQGDLVGITKQGVRVPLRVNLTPLSPEEEQLTAIWVADRTEHAALEERFNLAIEGAPSGLVFLDEHGSIVRYNRQAGRDFGYDRTELLGQPIEVLTSESAAPGNSEHRRSYLADLQQRPMGQGRELLGRRKDGSEFPAVIGLTPIPTADGSWTMASIVDISERKRTEQEIHEQNDDLLDFVYSASHDLKAPLSTIRGLVSIARDDLDEGNLKSVEDLLQRIELKAKKLSKLVEDTLALARSERIEESCETVRLAEVVAEVADEIEFVAEHEGVRLHVQASPEATIHSSPQRIRVIVDNLLRNSIKYHAPHRSDRYVNLTVHDAGDRVVMQVEDNGIGIPQPDQDKVFGMFKRFHPGHADGSGLGLAMVRKQVSSLGGSIRFSSSPEGTTFFIDLPKEQQP